MSRVCQICQKRVQSGHQISHAHNKTKRRWLPNLQKVRVLVDGIPKKITICTRCLRSGKVVKAP